MKCPKCGEEMEEGYVGFLVQGLTRLFWYKEKPVGFVRWLKGEKAVKPDKLLDIWEFGPTRKGFKCANCKLVTFEY